MTESIRLTEEEKLNVTGSGLIARGLPNRCYTDIRFLSHEYETFFQPRWIAIGVGAEIPNPGDVKPVNVSGIPLLLLRDQEGQIRTFYNVCSHRGLKLVDTQCSGKRTLVCPYHSWGYHLDGQLFNTPDIGGQGKNSLPGFDKSEFGLKSARTGIWQDVIFVNLSNKAPELDVSLEPVTTRWQDYDFSHIHHGGQDDAVLEQVVDANWKIVVENFLDIYHLPFVHGGSLQKYSPIEERETFVEDHFIGIRSRQYFPERGKPLPAFPGLTDQQARAAEYCYLAPNLCLGITRDHLMIIIVEPLTERETRLNINVYFADGSALDNSYKSSRQATKRDMQQVLAEDHEIVNRLQAGRQSQPAFKGGYFSLDVEMTTHALHKFLANEL